MRCQLFLLTLFMGSIALVVSGCHVGGGFAGNPDGGMQAPPTSMNSEYCYCTCAQYGMSGPGTCNDTTIRICPPAGQENSYCVQDTATFVALINDLTSVVCPSFGGSGGYQCTCSLNPQTLDCNGNALGGSTTAVISGPDKSCAVFANSPTHTCPDVQCTGQPGQPCSKVSACQTSSKVCAAFDATGDPATFSPLNQMADHRVFGAVDPTTSQLNVTVSFSVAGINHCDVGHTNFDDSGSRDCGTSSTAYPPHLSGEMILYAGDHSQVKVDLHLTSQDFKFHYFAAPDFAVKDLVIIGASDDNTFALDANGHGTIYANTLELQFLGEEIDNSGNITPPFYIDKFNIADVPIDIDFAAKTFHLSGSLPIQNVSGSFDLFGTLVSQPPVAVVSAPPNPVECKSSYLLDGSQSTDPDNDIALFSWFGGPGIDSPRIASGSMVTVQPPLGASDYTFLVTDHRSNIVTKTVELDAKDTLPPAVTPPPDIVVECTSPNGQAVNIGTATAKDQCDPSPVISSNAPPLFSFGTTTVQWSATDASGNVGTADQKVSVVDTNPPTLTLSVSPAVLWPPNHKLIPIHVTATASDPCTASVPIRLIAAVATEPGDNETIPLDAIQGAVLGTADFDMEVKAERNGQALQGRLYTFTYEATNIAGLTTTASITVTVPHDQGK